jgi:hypothetical protein
MSGYGAAVALLLLGLITGYGIHSHRTRENRQESQVQASAPLPPTMPLEFLSQGEAQSQRQETEKPGRGAGKGVRNKRAAPVATPLPVLTAELTIESSPQGAQIQLDGRGTGSTTPSALTQLNAGEHTVTLTKDGYAVEHRTVQLRAAQRATLAVPLSELPASVSISSQPEGASVLVDGKDTGKVTPLTVAVPKGSHAITLTRNGFFPATRTLESLPGKAYEFPVRLTPMGASEEIKGVGKLKKVFGGGTPQSMGKVQIRSNPKGAQIAVNGRVMDKLTPAEYFFPAGTYEVTLTVKGYKPSRKTINVGLGAKLLVDELLDKTEP